MTPISTSRSAVELRDTFNHPPIHSLRLESTEALVLAETKRNRPVIVIGGASATELKPGTTTLADTVMVIPIYGADQYDDHTRKRIAYYEFTNAFYLPAFKAPRSMRAPPASITSIL